LFRFGGNRQLWESFLTLGAEFPGTGLGITLICISDNLFGLRARGGNDVLILLHELLSPLVFKSILIVGIEVFFVLDQFDIGWVHFHVWRAIVKHSWRYDWHRVRQLPQFWFRVCEAAIDAKLAATVDLEVLAVLSFVVAV
jgi:hypothetical protein